MNNLKNEGDSPFILPCRSRRIIPKPLETRQIPLDSPCAKCGESSGKLGAGRQPKESSLHCAKCGSFIKWVSASELKKIEKRVLLIDLHNPATDSEHQGTPDKVTRIVKPATGSEHSGISVSKKGGEV